MVFWTMAYIMDNPEVYKSVRKEIDEALPQHSKWPTVSVIDSLTLINFYCLPAIKYLLFVF